MSTFSTVGDDTSSSGQPAWLSAAIKLGVPSLIALFLVLWMTQRFSADAKAMAEDVKATKAAVEQHINDMRSDAKIQRALLGAICENTAQSNAQRAACAVGR